MKINMIQKVKNQLLKLKIIKYYSEGKRFINDSYYQDVQIKSRQEISKRPSRTDIINYLLSIKQGQKSYLEIGVRNPEDNFNRIAADKKYGVDPGIEFKQNPVEFNLTSDEFFLKLSKNEILSSDIKFDVIFIDGLHLAEQVDKDIENALLYIKDDGFVVLHDCNPPTEWHARESYHYSNTPAHYYWNGTTWKAFLKWRFSSVVNSCCIDTDWGVGILSKKHKIGTNMEPTNSFFEFNIFDCNRKKYLNLVDFDTFKNSLRN